MTTMQPLPIDPLLPRIAAVVGGGGDLVLVAPPGAGKTTRVPRALLERGVVRGEVLVLEPRRLAARLSAHRVADELGERVGETVGYRMRFEDATGPSTRLCFVTEGILTRRLLVDPELRGVAVVVLDELHERHLHGDVALALLRRLQRGRRPDLRIVAMSATLDAAHVAAFLGALTLRSEGRAFEVEVEHLPRKDDRALELQVVGAVRRLVDDGLDGHVLVFLPGAAEIRRAMEACGPLARSADLLVVPLHGSLSAAEQDRAVLPAGRRKLILSTNVAETSITIDGVAAVVDSGLARIASSSPWSGLPALRIGTISRASAAQRAGRAGRTRAGRCLRLYTRADLAARPEHELPEVARADLAETVLALVASGASDPASFEWLDAPPAAALSAACELLVRLGAVVRLAAPSGAGYGTTPLGRRMLRFPVHPRQARMLVEAERRGVAGDGCVLAALVGEGDVLAGDRAGSLAARAGGGAFGGVRRAGERHSSDLLLALERLERAEEAGLGGERLRAAGLDPGRVEAVRRVRRQLAKLVDGRAAPEPASRDGRERALLASVLAGYPDRVGRLRRPDNATGRAAREIAFAFGGSAALAGSSAVEGVDLVVAVDAEERVEGRGPRIVVRSASAIEADWLLETLTDSVEDTTEVTWNPASERVEVVRRLAYGKLVLEESRAALSSADRPAAARVLSEAARAKGWRAFAREDVLDGWLARLSFVNASCPDAGLPRVTEADVEEALDALCASCASFAELREAGLDAAVRARLSPAQARALDELAPGSIALPGGRRARLDYGGGGAPSFASRLQDFFGMARGPAVAGGRVPVVLHLLAPNQRAVQITTDLAGFWSRHYPAIAKELRRRYPKHAWPDDPLTASPPAPRPR